MSAWPNAPLQQEEEARGRREESRPFSVIKRRMVVSITNLRGGAPTSRSNRRNGTPAGTAREHLAPLTGAQSLP
jgi:hypothetical protein